MCCPFAKVEMKSWGSVRDVSKVHQRQIHQSASRSVTMNQDLSIRWDKTPARRTPSVPPPCHVAQVPSPLSEIRSLDHIDTTESKYFFDICNCTPEILHSLNASRCQAKAVLLTPSRLLPLRGSRVGPSSTRPFGGDMRSETKLLREPTAC